MRRIPRILVVDDVFDIVGLLSELLSHVAGYETQTANDGFEAIRAAEEFRPDVILFDIAMPVLNGFDRAKRIRSETWGRNILFIGMSGYGDTKYARRARKDGFKEYLPKPSPLKRIMDMVEQFSHPDLTATSRNLPEIYSRPRAVNWPVAEGFNPVSRALVFFSRHIRLSSACGFACWSSYAACGRGKSSLERVMLASNAPMLLTR